MPGKMARSGSQTPLGRSGMSGAPTLSHLGFQPVQKTRTIHVSSAFIWGIPVYRGKDDLSSFASRGKSSISFLGRALQLANSS
jgi:hypothetical protein